MAPKYLITYLEFTMLNTNKDIIIFTPKKTVTKIKTNIP